MKWQLMETDLEMTQILKSSQIFKLFSQCSRKEHILAVSENVGISMKNRK